MGLINVNAGIAAFSSGLPKPLRRGPVALVSQSGGLGMTALTPLMTDRELGFAYFVSCGNQLGATVEDFVEAFAQDAAVSVIAIIIETRSKIRASSGRFPVRPSCRGNRSSCSNRGNPPPGKS